MPARFCIAWLFLASLATAAGAADTEPPAAPLDPGAPPTEEPPETAARVLAPDLRPRIYVKDLDHLAVLVKDDPEIEGKVRAIARRGTTALTIGGILLATGLVIATTGIGDESCHSEYHPFPGPGTVEVCQPDGTQVVVGSGLMTAGFVLALALAPGSGDLLDVINAWNVSHPDRPFELSSGRHARVTQVTAP